MTHLRLAHPSTNHFAQGDPDPIATERAIIAFLAEQPRYTSVRKGHIQKALYGTTLVGADRLSSALGRLNNKKLVVRMPDRRSWKISEAGRLWHEQWRIFDGEDAS